MWKDFAKQTEIPPPHHNPAARPINKIENVMQRSKRISEEFVVGTEFKIPPFLYTGDPVQLITGNGPHFENCVEASGKPVAGDGLRYALIGKTHGASFEVDHEKT